MGWTDETRDQVLRLSKENKTIREIAGITGMGKSSIGTFLKRQKETVPAPANNPVPEVEQPTADMSIDESAAKEFMAEVTNPAKSATFAHSKAENFIEGLLSSDEVPAPPPKKATRAGAPKRQSAKAKANVIELMSKDLEDPALKGDLIARITLNVNTFEPLLMDFLKPNKEAFLTGLPKRSVRDLEATLKSLETTRSVANMTNQFLQFFYMGTSMVEMGTQRYLSMNTQGFTHALQAPHTLEEIRLIMKELCMERVNSFKQIQKPEVRLAMIVSTTLLGVHAQNSMMAARQQAQPQKAAAQIRPAVAKPSEPEAAPKAAEAEPKPQPPPKPANQVLIPEDTVSQFTDL